MHTVHFQRVWAQIYLPHTTPELAKYQCSLSAQREAKDDKSLTCKLHPRINKM